MTVTDWSMRVSTKMEMAIQLVVPEEAQASRMIHLILYLQTVTITTLIFIRVQLKYATA